MISFPMIPRFPASLSASLCVLMALAGCSRGTTYKPMGSSSPTVSGASGVAYENLEAARAAFSRSDGPLTAVLEDSAWIRFEGDAETVQQKHPDYFRGFTVFDVSLSTQHFVRPTDETYLLEDSTGASVSSKPEVYSGDIAKGFGPKHMAQFTVVFPHAMGPDVRWLRLTRQGAEGGSVRWDFPK